MTTTKRGRGRPVIHVALYSALDGLSLGEELEWPITSKTNASRVQERICWWSAKRNYTKLFRSKTVGDELIVRRTV